MAVPCIIATSAILAVTPPTLYVAWEVIQAVEDNETRVKAAKAKVPRWKEVKEPNFTSGFTAISLTTGLNNWTTSTTPQTPTTSALTVPIRKKIFLDIVRTQYRPIWEAHIKRKKEAAHQAVLKEAIPQPLDADRMDKIANQ